MSRADESAQAQQLLLNALKSTPSLGMPEGTLRRMTNLRPSLFQEAMKALMATQRVVVSKQGGRQNLTEYHLVQQQERRGPQDGPLSPLATAVLERLNTRAEGARGLSKALNVELGLILLALDELEAAGQVIRRQVGMLVIYRGISFQ